MTARLAIAVVLGLCACGDNRRVDDLFEPVSGARLKLEWHLYEDGTQQATGEAFYDIEVHSRCTPRPWIDGVVRCVPIADEAFYIDAACANLVGRVMTIEKPTHFIGYATVAGTPMPARLYRAGPPTTPVTELYEKRDGVCVGPFTSLSDVAHHQLVDEIDGSDLIPLGNEELGAGRLALQILTTDDGLRVPAGLRDRELDQACTPTPRAGGAFSCAPTEAATIRYFHDSVCEQSIVTIAGAQDVPRFATFADPSGCARYHAVGDELTGPVYERRGEACTRIFLAPPRQFLVGAELDLAPLGRTLEDAPGRRLQRIILTDDDLRFVDARLYDTATRADCLRRSFGKVARCLPAAVADATVLRTRSCALEVRVAEIPLRTCERIGFATAIATDEPAIYAVGDLATEPLFQLTDVSCLPYASAPSHELRSLGPPIAPETFPAVVSYGER